MTTRKFQLSGLGLATVLLAANTSLAQTFEPPQAVGLGQWSTDPVFTIGESINGYTPPGIPDGQGAWDRGDTVEIAANHELTANAGYLYTLANGAQLTGARRSSLETA